MKTFLPQIERRIVVRPNQTFGILNYDMDNAYPQRMLELVSRSPTAKDCWNKRAKFIAGNGFEDATLGKQVINSKGLTMAKLLKAIATDKALFCGFGIHVNYNANCKIASVNYVKFEDIRMGDTDDVQTAGKFAIYNDWGRRTWKHIMRSKITFLDSYNPDAEVVKRQVIAAGGWSKYKGQLFYFNADDAIGLKAGSAINQLLLSTLSSASKIATLVHAYGLKQSEAEAMVNPHNQL
jgi:hypothetical protein